VGYTYYPNGTTYQGQYKNDKEDGAGEVIALDSGFEQSGN